MASLTEISLRSEEPATDEANNIPNGHQEADGHVMEESTVEEVVLEVLEEMLEECAISDNVQEPLPGGVASATTTIEANSSSVPPEAVPDKKESPKKSVDPVPQPVQVEEVVVNTVVEVPATKVS